jgi:hypothetical protein
MPSPAPDTKFITIISHKEHGEHEEHGEKMMNLEYFA